MHQFVTILGFAFFLSVVQTQDRIPFDPSTVINIYPSLQKLMKNEEDDDSSLSDFANCEDDSNYDKCVAAASEVKPNWIDNNKEKDKKSESAPTKLKLLSDSSIQKKSKKNKSNGKSKPTKEQQPGNVTPSQGERKAKLNKKIRHPYENDEELPRANNWHSFHDIVQLLKNRKH